jgi:hypothetical protein
MRRAILFVSLGSLLALVASQTAFATHPHPANNGADKLTFPQVPAFKACGTPNTTHGAPLGAPSCTPANATKQTSGFITTGQGTSFKGTSSFVIDVSCTNGAVPPCSGTAGDQEDVKLTATATDIRCKAAAAAAVCGNENGAPAGPAGDDYIGEVQGNATIRITDAYNGPPGFVTHGTVVDLPFPVPAHGAGPNTVCKNTAVNTIGATCTIATSADAQVPAVVKEGKQANVEIGQIFVRDGGSDGDIDTAAGNTVFSVQGIYIP